MADLRAAASASPAESQRSAGDKDRRSRAATATETATATTPTDIDPTTPGEPNEYLQSRILADIEIIATYFAVEKPTTRVAHALERVRDAAIELAAKPKPNSTETAVRQLHEAVRKLSNQVETTKKPSYATIAGQGVGPSRKIEPI